VLNPTVKPTTSKNKLVYNKTTQFPVLQN